MTSVAFTWEHLHGEIVMISFHKMSLKITFFLKLLPHLSGANEFQVLYRNATTGQNTGIVTPAMATRWQAQSLSFFGTKFEFPFVNNGRIFWQVIFWRFLIGFNINIPNITIDVFTGVIIILYHATSYNMYPQCQNHRSITPKSVMLTAPSGIYIY